MPFPGGLGSLRPNRSQHQLVDADAIRLFPSFGENAGGYIAYYARYEVDPGKKTVTHHRRNHLNPEIGSLSVVRHFSFDGDVLTLTVYPEPRLRLNWIKVR